MTTFVIGGALGAVTAFALSYVIARWRELTRRANRMAEYPESLRLGRRNPGYRMDSRGITRAADGALILPPSHEPGMLPKVDRPGERITVAPAKVRPEVQSERDVARVMASQYAADTRANLSHASLRRLGKVADGITRAADYLSRYAE